MIKVSNDFKTAMKQPVKELQAFIEADSQTISDEDELISFKVSGEGGLCKSVMRKFEAKYLGEHNLLGKWVSAGFGVKLPSGAYDFLKYGSFLVNELTISKDTGTTSVVAYDKMINAMKPYEKLDVEYPVRLLDYANLICEACNLEISGKPVLPVEYQEVKYLQSSKTQYIDTGIKANQDTSVVLKFDSILADGEYYNAPFGSRDANDSTQFFIGLQSNSDAKWFFRYGKNTYYAGFGEKYGYNELTAHKNVWTLNNGANTFPYENFQSDYSMYLFGLNYAGNFDRGFNGRIYSCKIYDNDTLVRDFVPCYRKRDNVIGMYDLVNGAFYTNSGTGAFIKGEDIVADTYTLGSGAMNDWQVTAAKDEDGNVVDLWENIDGITYRDIFVQIAQATASTCIIGADDKVYFKPIANTGEQLTYDNLFKLKLEDQYGEINSVVLSRTPIEGEDVFLKDDASVATNGLTEFKIENNEIVDKNREDAITPLYNALKGTKYYPFEATTEGLGWYEIGDSFNIVTDTGDVFNTTLFNFTITMDGSLKETLKTVAETKTQTQYQYATTITKRIKNTEMVVDKQNGKISSLVSDIDDVNEKYTQIKQDIDNIEFRVQNSGGGNLIKDSVMLAYANIDQQKEDQLKLSPWVVSGGGTITAQSDANANNVGAISGHSFTLNNKTATQTVTLNGGTEGNKAYYTFSTKIKKSAVGTCYVKIYNAQESIILAEVSAGESPYYAEYSKTFEPKGGKYTIEFYGSADSVATFTDNMLSVGEYKSQWTQANGEVMNTQVNVSTEGIRVNRVNKDGEIIDGEYTVMSPTEFAGYSNNKEVFSLNKDVTEVEKLKARTEMTMAPIKIVPITTGDLQGWAFVPST